MVKAQSHDADLKFRFGKQTLQSTDLLVDTAQPFSNENGYGFDFDTANNVQINYMGFNGDNAPIYFSVRVPEGNYKVKIDFQASNVESTMVLKAESRRLMLDTLVQPNTTFSKSIVLNIRTPKISDDKKIILKERELTYLNWDNKLTLEFLGNATVSAIEITPITEITNIFLTGDSTVTDQDLEPWASWGQFITHYFTNESVVANYAYSGASLSSFKGSHRLEKIKSLLQKGDYLLIQFGHNDQKQKGVNDGPWLNYTQLLMEFIKAAREKEAIPILLTPVQRRFFGEEGKLKPTHGDYPNAVRAVAEKMNVPLIDLTKITTTLYESWGDKASRKAFVQYPAHTFPGQDTALEDNTHFNAFGANEIALCVIQDIKKQGLSIGSYLKENIPKYNPAFPNKVTSWTLPMSRRFEPIKPDGN